jgi:hypothetical protein
MPTNFELLLRKRIARETLRSLPELLPGGIFTETASSGPLTTWVVDTRAQADDILTKLGNFETIECWSGGVQGRFWVQAYPAR